MGLSCVRLEKIEENEELGPVLHIAGADLMAARRYSISSRICPMWTAIRRRRKGHRNDEAAPAGGGDSEQWLAMVPEEKREALTGILANDPRPSYQHVPARVYGFSYAGLEVRFTVADGRASVCEICPGEEGRSAGHTERGKA